ncbi:hypothetical protein GCM10007989_07570 [Devosia pacifica]|uniref:Chromosomal replication initiator DnaA C-terminal domain-containing protein n=1 Tax=Devosia pacifica TaxID=1335967 RepID=A0A918VQC5_9HYPH|nr:helix-turn-helix domain-containing protein [Devosia pacifica]GHA15291.1 hypothetical protein GCM10007989_07570 [Devosia pacifica]
MQAIEYASANQMRQEYRARHDRLYPARPVTRLVIPASPEPKLPRRGYAEPIGPRKPTEPRHWAEIVAVIAASNGVTAKDIISPSKVRPIANARFEAIYQLRIEKRMSWAAIARCLGNRDITTVRSAYFKHVERLEARRG